MTDQLRKRHKPNSKGFTSETQPRTQQRPIARFSENTVPHELVAARAYQAWLARGGVHGYDRQDWFQAERELTAAVVNKKIGSL